MLQRFFFVRGGKTSGGALPPHTGGQMAQAPLPPFFLRASWGGPKKNREAQKGPQKKRFYRPIGNFPKGAVLKKKGPLATGKARRMVNAPRRRRLFYPVQSIRLPRPQQVRPAGRTGLYAQAPEAETRSWRSSGPGNGLAARKDNPDGLACCDEGLLMGHPYRSGSRRN